MQLDIIFQIIWALIKWIKNKVYRLTKWVVTTLLRCLFFFSQPRPKAEAGFILPTTVLLILVVTLAVGSMTLRTLNRTGQVNLDRQQRVIYNAATPTIERAKAKLEYLFSDDSSREYRYPNGVPDQDVLLGMMLNDGQVHGGYTVEPHAFFKDVGGNSVDPYTFPDENGDYDTVGSEHRIDIDGDGNDDNAWAYRIDLNEDGVIEAPEEGSGDATVAYSIIFSKPPNTDTNSLTNASDAAISERAKLLEVRHGPLSIPVQDGDCSGAGVASDASDDGWSKPTQGGASLYKNFQVNALVIPDDPLTSVATLEFHQDRKIDEGNKWGAWFRNDLEIFPGKEFRWNGAMHTEGSLLVGNSNFEAYLISAPASCYYTRENSEITFTERTAKEQPGHNNFEGQVLLAQLTDDQWTDDNYGVFHLFTDEGYVTDVNKTTMKKEEDSAKETDLPSTYLLDPVVLVTQDVSKARGFASDTATEDGNPKAGRNETYWNEENEENKFLGERRLFNKFEETPSVDDSFRADNRYGPRPRVDGKTIPGVIGAQITGNLMSSDSLADDDLLRLGPSAGDEATDFSNVGLDGYWERRARAEGMRVIVGQRLELGNAFGWRGGLNENGNYVDDLNQEPLMPWDGGCTENATSRCGETRQRRTLRDNLAAVQSAAIYHSSASTAGNDFPVACLAATVHPGTGYTLANSSTFLDWTKDLEAFWGGANAAPTFISDFFRGEGTNGWEYETPAEATFATAIGSTQPLGKVLRNLARFSGDPLAGAPTFTPTQDIASSTTAVVHPYPTLTMWGDFSILRRIFDEELDANPAISYANLSPADKTTLQTAACSVGMLAHELLALEDFNYGLAPNVTKYGPGTYTLLDVLNARLVALNLDRESFASGADYEARVRTELGLGTLTIMPGYWENPPTTYANRGINFDNLGNVDPEAYISRLQQWHDIDQDAVDDDLINLAKIIMLREQTLRDRTFGFQGAPANPQINSPNCGGVLNITVSGNPNQVYGPITDLTSMGGLSQLCSSMPKFGALYSIFPGETPLGANRDGTIDRDDNHGEHATRARGSLSDGERTTIIGADLNAGIGYEAINRTELAAIALNPRLPSAWELPHNRINTTSASGEILTPNNSLKLWVTCNVDLCSSGASTSGGAYTYQTQHMDVAFKDAGMYNGRELMSVRAMDMDLGMMRTDSTALGNDPKGKQDMWLPNSGIIYVFREDAVREDAITRIAEKTWENCNTDAAYVDANSSCHMAKLGDSANIGIDPPLALNKISPKPVDYYADPDRRPHGFRLRNGSVLKRTDDQGRGLSLISDNAVYIKGDFNLHQTSGGTALEEFTEHLTTSNFNNFYTRTTINPQFASAQFDEWRPSEILADAITILSDNFCDGSMMDGFHATLRNQPNNPKVLETETDGGRKDARGNKLPWRSLYGCPTANIEVEQTSYNNGYYPEVTIANNPTNVSKNDSESGYEEYWHRENPFDTRSPYAITRRGQPRFSDTFSAYSDAYTDIGSYEAKRRKTLAQDTTVNAIIVSGITPSRPGQTYGGLHNFPRFLERWKKNGNNVKTAKISGSLMQLNYSHTSTGPYDQDAWEVGTQPLTQEDVDRDNNDDIVSHEFVYYYSAPTRLWGYDVGLQKGVAGPMARRFVSGAEPTRSEFYSEPPADDPYIYNLCQAISTECFRSPAL